MLNELNAGRRLSLAGERQASRLRGRYGVGRHKGSSRRSDDATSSGKVTDGDIERVLDAATDRNGRPMFPKR